jgi:hypothetical protein
MLMTKKSLSAVLLAALSFIALAPQAAQAETWAYRTPYFAPERMPANGILWQNDLLTLDDWRLHPDWRYRTIGYRNNTLNRFHHNGVFHSYQPLLDRNAGVVQLGIGFYNLSAAEQRRALSLFNASRGRSETLYLEDGLSGIIVGVYTP